MLFQQLPHTYRSPFSTGKLPRLCGSVFLKKHALLQLRRCQNTQPRRGRESSVRRVGGFYRGSPASIQTCIVKSPVNTRLSDADSANTRPRLVIRPVAAGTTKLLFRPGGSETCRGFSSRYNIRGKEYLAFPTASSLKPLILKIQRGASFAGLYRAGNFNSDLALWCETIEHHFWHIQP